MILFLGNIILKGMVKKKRDKRIHEFDPCIYPRKLWVMRADTPGDIDGVFCERNGENIVFDIEEGSEPVLTTFPLVMLKQTGKYGTLVVLWEDNPTNGHVAHESGHVAITMLSELGIALHVDNQEPITYMIGWVADKIHEVLSGKFKED